MSYFASRNWVALRGVVQSMKIRNSSWVSAVAVTGLLSIALLSITACNPGRKDDDGNLMVIHTYERDDAKTLDPASAYDTVSNDIIPNIYETLFQYSYLSETL